LKLDTFKVTTMIDNTRERLIFHGAVVLCIGLLCGYPAVMERSDLPFRVWHAAHMNLLTTGIWMLAVAGAQPALALEKREAYGLLWSLMAAGYGLMLATPFEAYTGMRAIEPAGPPANLLGFLCNAIAILGALLASLLTVMGARAALRRARAG
jgi:hypothetical protein